MDDNPWGQATPSSNPESPRARPESPSPGLSTADSTGPDWDASSDVDDALQAIIGVRPRKDEDEVVTASNLANEHNEAADPDLTVQDVETVPETSDESQNAASGEVDGDEEQNEAQDGIAQDEQLNDATQTDLVTRQPVLPTLAMDGLGISGPPMDDFPDDDDFASPSQPEAVGIVANDDFDVAEDDFDDFGDATNGAHDDDFGDFGDFDDAEAGDFDLAEQFEPIPAPVPQRPPPPAATTSFTGYPPLRLNLEDSSSQAIAEQLRGFFQDIYPTVSEAVSNEPERQVEGAGQVLVTEQLRNLLGNLSTIPPLRPLDWRRSRIRREHLITLGVPINLDDSAEAKPMASLVLPSVHPSPVIKTASPLLSQSQGSPRPSSPFSPISRTPTPFADRERSRASNQAPPLDRSRIDALCSIPTDDLSLMSLPKLQALLDEIDQLTEDASGALTHALLMREKETGDTETYNNMIQDLVTAAAKVTSTSARGNTPPARSGSGRWGRTIK